MRSRRFACQPFRPQRDATGSAQAIIAFMLGLCLATAVPGGLSAQQASRTRAQPDPAVVARNVQTVRASLRTVDGRFRRVLALDSLKGSSEDVVEIRSEIESVAGDSRQLDQRLARV